MKKDWHPAQIVCALKMAGWSLRKLSKHYGYHPSVLGYVIKKRWPKGERIIADTLGLKPEEIWPSRYEAGSVKPRGPKSEIFRLPDDVVAEVNRRIDSGDQTIESIYRWLIEKVDLTGFEDVKISRSNVSRYARNRRKQRSVKDA